MSSKTTAAMNRAHRRGVDLMETNPRPLRNARRIKANDPRVTIYNGWKTTFNAMENSIQKLSTTK